MAITQTKAASGAEIDFGRVWRWKYSPSLFFSALNTLCSVVFQFAILAKLGVGARSDLYFAAVVTPLVASTLAFGAFNCVLVPMFVQCRAEGRGEEVTLLWNCLLVTVAGASLLSILLYYPVLAAFPMLFRRLAWIDLGEVRSVLIMYSSYQVFYLAMLVKNCFLFAQGRPVPAQLGVFCGWVVSLGLLWRAHPVEKLGEIPLCLLAGNVVALLFPSLGREIIFYRRGWLKRHAGLLLRRTWPVTAGCAASWAEPAFDGVIASMLPAGSLTLYYVFSRMMLYAATSIYAGYIQPVSKQLAELAAADCWLELRQQTGKVVARGATLGFVLLSIGLMAVLLLAAGGVPALHPYFLIVRQNLPVLLLLMGYLVGLAGHAGYSNGLYVLGRERLFMVASLVLFPAGILAKYWGARSLGVKGLAAATSAYWILYAAGLGFCFSLAIQQRLAKARRERPDPLAPSVYPAVLGEQGIEL